MDRNKPVVITHHAIERIIDECVKCGSRNIKEVEKELTFEFKNPGKVTLVQDCEECQECHETYFDEKQSLELARKLDARRKKV